MIFYKATAMIDDEKWCEENNDRRIKFSRTLAIAGKSEEYNEKHGEEAFCFVSDIGDNDITFGIFSYETTDVQKHLGAFIKRIGVKAKDPVLSEITMQTARNLLTSADRSNYIDDDDEVLEKLELDGICGFQRRLDFGENLVNYSADKSALYSLSERLLTEETLTPELDRIYSGRTNPKAVGHPVHYIIETGDNKTRKDLYRALLQALYNNDRLKSRRYCFVDIKPGHDFSRFTFDTLYKSCSGGAVVVRYIAGDDSEEEEYASSDIDAISVLCETMLKYRNQVLTVFCLPRECDKTKKLFYEQLGSAGMVEIREDLADIAKSTVYLKKLCIDSHIRPDKKLFAGLEEEKLYLPDELRAIFEEWYNKKIKTSVFPQYKNIESGRKEAVKNAARGSAYDELQKMIGLREAKEVINKALNYYKIQKIYKDKGVKQDRPAMHMVFTGNPGTAKTTAARLFARIMKENGLLSKGQLVEVGRSDLVGKYVGWTAQIVKDKFKSAMGGVLFIDEAYSLADDRGGSFGDEAINTIVQEMENRREDLVVIFAGYPEEMEHFLDKNPGLRSRIAFHVPFADYDTDELCQIARLIGKSKGLSLTDRAIEKMSEAFDIAKTQPDFGNGRYVRNVIELSRMNQANRILGMDPDKVTEKDLCTIDDADIEIPKTRAIPKKRIIGFAS